MNSEVCLLLTEYYSGKVVGLFLGWDYCADRVGTEGAEKMLLNSVVFMSFRTCSEWRRTLFC